jgi:hypothetical protein
MSSRFGIEESDLTPVPVNAADWADLIESVNGVDGLSLDTVVVQAENEMVGHMTGMFADAVHVALGKPFATNFVVWRLHFVKAQNAAYKIPEAVQAAYAAAVKWAGTTGKKLLESEGAGMPGAGPTQYSAPDTDWGMGQTEDL